jgi:RHS repeat-associated protein
MEVVYTSNRLNQYTAVNGVALTYDGNGNLISDGINNYAYDAENRLIAAVTPTHTASYAYDPFDRRIAKTVDGATTRYLHDGGQVIMEYDGSGQMLRRYVYGPGIDQPISILTMNDIYYYHFDALGSVIALSSANGQIVETYAYSPFGHLSRDGEVSNPYLYTGREYDEETGLHYYRARYYHPELGRFLQVDPITYESGMNIYAYAENRPVDFRDPLGLQVSSRNNVEKILSKFTTKPIERIADTGTYTRNNLREDLISISAEEVGSTVGAGVGLLFTGPKGAFIGEIVGAAVTGYTKRGLRETDFKKVAEQIPIIREATAPHFAIQSVFERLRNERYGKSGKCQNGLSEEVKEATEILLKLKLTNPDKFETVLERLTKPQ